MGNNSYDLAVLDIEPGQSALTSYAGLKPAIDKPAVFALLVSGKTVKASSSMALVTRTMVGFSG